MAKLNDAQRKTVAIMALAELYGRHLSDPGARMFVAALQDIPADAVERACGEAARASVRMPVPAELRELAGETRLDDRAALAWTAVLKAVAAVGGYRSVDFDDPLINATILSLGGWVALCEQTAREQDEFTRARFLKTYAAFSRTGVNGELAGRLPGLSERHNATHGHARASVVKIATGLPWAGQEAKKLGAANRRPASPAIPRLELKKA